MNLNPQLVLCTRALLAHLSLGNNTFGGNHLSVSILSPVQTQVPLPVQVNGVKWQMVREMGSVGISGAG